MTNALIDTQALLWFLNGDERLSLPAAARIAEPESELFFSYAGVWEIVIKHGKGKLDLPEPPEPFLLKQLTLNKIRLLPISIGSIFRVSALPPHHGDPFDRIIAAQCLRNDLTDAHLERRDLRPLRRRQDVVARESATDEHRFTQMKSPRGLSSATKNIGRSKALPHLVAGCWTCL